MICMLPSWEGGKQGKKEEEEEDDDEKETHVKVNDEELKRVSDLLNKGGDAIFLCKTEKKKDKRKTMKGKAPRRPANFLASRTRCAAL